MRGTLRFRFGRERRAFRSAVRPRQDGVICRAGATKTPLTRLGSVNLERVTYLRGSPDLSAAGIVAGRSVPLAAAFHHVSQGNREPLPSFSSRAGETSQRHDGESGRNQDRRDEARLIFQQGSLRCILWQHVEILGYASLATKPSSQKDEDIP